MQTTVVLVHGAYADSSSWNEVAKQVTDAGHRAIAYANPLRTVAGDAAGLTELVRATDGPIVLVGHSYGGAVITNVPAEAGAIAGLVFVAGFALEPGESCGDASSLVPGGTLAETLERVPVPGGGFDTYITAERFHEQFCADVPAREAASMAIAQRPITEAALFEHSGDAPLWRDVPSWFVFGDRDRNIPVGAHRIMGKRASARRVTEVPGASHVVGISHPSETAALILEAAASRQLTEA